MKRAVFAVLAGLSLQVSAQTIVRVEIFASDPTATEIPEVPPDMERPQLVDPAIFTVYRSWTTNIDLPVYYSISGTAANGVDYRQLSGRVTIPAGARQARIEVYPVDDFLVEGPESVIITLEQPPCIAIAPPPPDCYTVGRANHATAWIQDDDSKSNIAPFVRITAPVNGAIFKAPATIEIAATTVDRDGYAPMVEFFAGTNKIGEVRIDFIQAPPPGEPIHFTFEWRDVPAGRYALTARATDDGGASAKSDPVFITVTDSRTNLPPNVRITAPPEGAVFRSPANIRIDATTVDHDGYAPTVEFFANDRKIGEQTLVFIQAPPDGTPLHFSLMWSNVATGDYVLNAVTTDDEGARGRSQPVRVSVVSSNVPPTNTAPVVTIAARDGYASEGGWNWTRNTSLSSSDTNSNGEIWWITDWHTNTATFVVRRDGNTNSDLAVYYNVEGAAANGIDYARLPGHVTIPAGRHSARITIWPVDDNVAEKLETIVLRLVPSPTAALSYRIGSPAAAGAVLADDDSVRPPCIRFSDGMFHVCLPAVSGSYYTLQCSPDLNGWIDLTSLVVLDGALHYLDCDAVSAGSRFYRVVPQPIALLEE